MAVVGLAQAEIIIKTNPNKSLIDNAKSVSLKLRQLINGENISLINDDYFENKDLFASRNKNKISNRDLFARVFHKETMIFNADGGSSYFTGLDTEQSAQLNKTLDNITLGVSLRYWMQKFCLPSFRVDPMGLIFLEIGLTGNPYPTYKAITSVFDYLPNGRQLEYVCFRLNGSDLKQFNITETNITDKNILTNYYRVVDDAKDTVYKYENNILTTISELPNPFKICPAFVISDIISSSNQNIFLSPAYQLLELAEQYQNDRSVRDLQKKYHGFAKAIEPLLQCSYCAGTGFVSGSACPECTQAGADKGTGYKLRTKVSDVARFPLEALKEGFDYRKVFGYSQLPIDVWDKQDASLNDLEELINRVYWGTESGLSKISGASKVKDTTNETATKTLSNLQPIYLRLNNTADWAEKTENIIVNLIAPIYFSNFNSSQISYGRNYILEQSYVLMEQYLDMKTKGAPKSLLDESLIKYIYSQFSTKPTKLSVELKMMRVEPFVHLTTQDVLGINPSKIDYYKKLYFEEWKAQQDFNLLLAKTDVELRALLSDYSIEKMKLEPVNMQPLQEQIKI